VPKNLEETKRNPNFAETKKIINYEGNLTDVSTVINTSDWTPGLYTISHMAGEHAITQKVIIK
jgi:hypothetical protein